MWIQAPDALLLKDAEDLFRAMPTGETSRQAAKIERERTDPPPIFKLDDETRVRLSRGTDHGTGPHIAQPQCKALARAFADHEVASGDDHRRPRKEVPGCERAGKSA